MGQVLSYDFPDARVRPAASLVAAREAVEGGREKEQITQKKLILSHNDLEKCLHEQKDGLLITNGDGIGLWVNKAMEKVVGLTPDFFLQKPINHLFENGIFQYQAVTERARCQKKRAYRPPGC
ncbi:MAG: PAS domain-containing protein [Bacillota bacterium]